MQVKRIALIVSFGILWAVSCFGLSPVEKRRVASELLFYLAGRDQVLSRDQLEAFLARADTGAGRLYARLEAERLRAQSEQASLTMKSVLDRDFIQYKAHRVRDAALAEILSLGDEVEEVLLKGVFSSRQDIVLGVVKALAHFDQDRSVVVLGEVLKRDRWGVCRCSLRVRREAIFSLGAIEIHNERKRRLLQVSLLDPEEKIRQAARDVVQEETVPWKKEALLQSYQKELELYQSRRGAYVERGVERVFDGEVIEGINVLRAFEVLVGMGELPGVMPPSELMNQRSFRILLLKHSSVLREQMRTDLLCSVLKDDSSGDAKVLALKDLRDSDREKLSVLVQTLISPRQDPDVLALAIALQVNWGGDGLRDQIEGVARGARQPFIRDLAESALKEL